MLSLDEILKEARRLPLTEQLLLLEGLAHSVRQQISSSQPSPETVSPDKSPEELGWPPGYFEETWGSLKDEPLERGEQGEYEAREEFSGLRALGPGEA